LVPLKLMCRESSNLALKSTLAAQLITIYNNIRVNINTFVPYNTKVRSDSLRPRYYFNISPSNGITLLDT
jgi:hypothetical protein